MHNSKRRALLEVSPLHSGNNHIVKCQVIWSFLLYIFMTPHSKYHIESWNAFDKLYCTTLCLISDIVARVSFYLKYKTVRKVMFHLMTSGQHLLWYSGSGSISPSMPLSTTPTGVVIHRYLSSEKIIMIVLLLRLWVINKIDTFNIYIIWRLEY